MGSRRRQTFGVSGSMVAHGSSGMIHIPHQSIPELLGGNNPGDRTSVTAPPVCILLPTFDESIADVKLAFAQGDIRAVGGLDDAHLIQSSTLLSELRSSVVRPNVIVMTDQLVSNHDASVLVRHGQGAAYFSPIELLLSSKYGYRLLVWMNRPGFFGGSHT